jgi:hypothetical protein
MSRFVVKNKTPRILDIEAPGFCFFESFDQFIERFDITAL